MFNAVDASGKCYPMTFPLTPQSITTYGFDGGKKVQGRLRHLVVDSQGLRIGVLVTEANGSERLGAVVVLKDYELYTQSSEAMIYGSFIRLMTRRLAA
jgi:hypothetical protein